MVERVPDMVANRIPAAYRGHPRRLCGHLVFTKLIPVWEFMANSLCNVWEVAKPQYFAHAYFSMDEAPL